MGKKTEKLFQSVYDAFTQLDKIVIAMYEQNEENEKLSAEVYKFLGANDHDGARKVIPIYHKGLEKLNYLDTIRNGQRNEIQQKAKALFAHISMKDSKRAQKYIARMQPILERISKWKPHRQVYALQMPKVLGAAPKDAKSAAKELMKKPPELLKEVLSAAGGAGLAVYGADLPKIVKGLKLDAAFTQNFTKRTAEFFIKKLDAIEKKSGRSSAVSGARKKLQRVLRKIRLPKMKEAARRLKR
jgi:hypothetical protein